MAQTPATPPPLIEPAVEFERRFQWRWWAMVAFLGLMLALAAVALASLLIPPRTLTGVPDDADARAAWALVRPGLGAGLTDLRFDTEIGVVASPDRATRADDLARAARAESLLECAARRRPDDPRLLSAIGHLQIARQMLQHAARTYQSALDLAPHHDEARLGLGVALSRLASVEADPLRQRRLQLQAIAQFAAVRPRSAVRLDAFYDRAALLADVGRRREARHWAEAYLAEAPADPWAERLRRRALAP
jgi:tetratricopeptide (TPR) repeat protein